MKVAIIMPARLKSSRLPQKLLLDRSGKTVLEHTIGQAQRAAESLKARVIVAADDAKLLDVARGAGVEGVLTRADHASGTDRIAEAAAKIDCDIVVNLQADEPEIDPAYIRTVAELLMAKGESAPMATLAAPIYNSENFAKSSVVKVVIAADGRALYFSRAPIPYLRDDVALESPRLYGYHHLGIYAYRKDFLLSYTKLPKSRLELLEKLEQLRALEAGYTIKVAVVPRNPPGIDTLEEYEAFLERKGN